jgi:hypothetical protein
MDSLGLFAILGIFLMPIPFVLGDTFYKRLGASKGKATPKSFLYAVLLAACVNVFLLVSYVILIAPTSGINGTAFLALSIIFLTYSLVFTLSGAYSSFRSNAPKESIDNFTHKIIRIALSILSLALILFFVFIFLWQIGSGEPYQSSVVTTGWAKLRPISASITYKSNGSFEATYQNTVGTSIRLTSITVKETLTGLPNECNITAVDSVDMTSGWQNVSVKAGDGFEIAVDCAAISEKEEGDPFDLAITIDYTAVMGGISTVHTESGHIRGPAEA